MTTYRAVVCQTNREEFPMMTNLQAVMIRAAIAPVDPEVPR